MIVEYVTIEEARTYLGISKRKIAKLVKDGILKTMPDTLGLKITLVKKGDVDKLKIRSNK
jgi:excisionase family DNA binding protein